MQNRLKISIFPIFIFLLSSCQIYHSTGRSLFDANVTSPTSNVGSPSFPLLAENKNSAKNDQTCWNQPKDEPLWFAENGKKYHVQITSEQTIEVCSEETEGTPL